MANDENLSVRTSILEYRMDMLVDIVEEIRANYVTKMYLDEVVSHLATKEDLKELVTKDELRQELRLLLTKEEFRQELKLLLTKEEFKQELQHYATKEDLQREIQGIRNWIIGMSVTLFFSLAGLQLAVFQIYLHGR